MSPGGPQIVREILSGCAFQETQVGMNTRLQVLSEAVDYRACGPWGDIKVDSARSHSLIFFFKVKNSKVGNPSVLSCRRCYKCGAFLVAQWERSGLLCRRQKRCMLDPCVGKIPWSRKWQLTPVFLPGKFHGQRSLVGYTVHGVTMNQT